jgi:probable FeS assembly SUF system protein SufT
MFRQQSEPVTLKRDVDATAVPVGITERLPEGSLVYITQAMGGSFTVYFEGNLYRIAGRDADALGKEPVTPPQLEPGATDEDFEGLVWDQLRTVYDPEIPINIVELGLIYECRIEKREGGERAIDIKMTVTAPGCGMGEILVDDVRERLKILPTVGEVNVELVFDPPWNQSMMSEAARLEAGLL